MPPLPLLFLMLLCATLGLLLPEPAARGYETSKLLNGIATEADVTTDLYVNLRPTLIDGLLRTNGDFGPELPLPPSPIVSRPAFLSFLSGPRPVLRLEEPNGVEILNPLAI